MSAESLTKKMGGKWYGDYGLVRCPAHDDRTASLSLRDGHSTVLFHCFAGCSNDEVLAAMKRARHYAPQSTTRAAPQPKKDLGELARKIWAGLPSVGNHTLAARYLASRKILIRSPALRYDPRAKYKEGKSYFEAPALIAAYHKADNSLVSIQRCLLDSEGQQITEHDPKRFLGLRSGALCRLFPLRGSVLPLAEGVEEALSVHRLRGLPCWSVGGIENYAAIEIPDHVEKIIVFTQHGDEARRALKRGRPNLTANGRALEVEHPDPMMDWNDMLMADDRFDHQPVNAAPRSCPQ